MVTLLKKVGALDLSALDAAGGRKLLLTFTLLLFLDLAVPMAWDGLRLLDFDLDAMGHGHQLGRLGFALLMVLLFFRAVAGVVRFALLLVSEAVARVIPAVFSDQFLRSSSLQEATERHAQLERTHVQEDMLLLYALEKNSSVAMQVYQRHQADRESRSITKDLLVVVCVLAPLDFLQVGSGGMVYSAWHCFDNAYPFAVKLLQFGMLALWIIFARAGLASEVALSERMVPVGSSGAIRRGIGSGNS